MPTFDIDELALCLKQLAQLDKAWLLESQEPDHLFIRLLHMSTDKTLGVRTPQNTKLVAIVNPVLLMDKNSAISLKCSTDVKRNWPLGHGRYRISGNFGPILPSVTDAKENGFDDVLWLLDDYVMEMTQHNIFVLQQSRFGNLELLTPPDNGCILNGVTRQTIVDMADEI